MLNVFSLSLKQILPASLSMLRWQLFYEQIFHEKLKSHDNFETQMKQNQSKKT